MIDKSIKIGSKVFNKNYGFGYFFGWHDENLEIAIIKFENSLSGVKEYLKRKDVDIVKRY